MTNVSIGREPVEDLASFFGLEIQGHAAFVPMQVLEVGAMTAAEIAGRILAGRLDLDHVCAPVGHLPRDGRSGTRPGQIEDRVVGKNLFHRVTAVIYLNRHPSRSILTFSVLLGEAGMRP